MTRLYMSRFREEVDKLLWMNHRFCGEPAFELHTRASLLPCRLSDFYGARFVYQGGVVSETGAFLAGLSRHDTDETLSYTVRSAYAADSTETLPACIFGGVLIGLFGHTITETLSRLWFLGTEKDLPDVPICFVATGKVPKHFMALMRLLGIEERVLVVDRPTRFERVFIPGQSLFLHAWVNRPYFRRIYERILECVAKEPRESRKSYTKLYLTRTHLEKSDCAGEATFEAIYAQNGYTVLALEEYALSDQIALLAKAEAIATTVGTLSHMAILFCRDDAKLTFLLRENEPEALIPQFVLNEMKDCEVSFVDATYNFLPTTHAGGVFLLSANEHFAAYARDNGLTYDADKACADLHKHIADYLHAYAVTYGRFGYAVKRLWDLSFFDFLSRFVSVVCGVTLDRADCISEERATLEEKAALLDELLGHPQILPVDSMTHCSKSKNARVFVIRQEGDFLAVGEERLPLASAIEAICREHPKFPRSARALLPFIYAGLFFDQYPYFALADLLVLDNEGSRVAFDPRRYLECAASNLDAVCFRVSFTPTLEKQYCAHHGKASWECLTRAVASDPFVHAVARYAGYSLKYLFARHFLIVRPKLFLPFFSWYRSRMDRILAELGNFAYLISPMTERLTTLYLYAHSLRSHVIGYCT
ncbi:MAG: glycosyltransferase family 61 protein [Desulfovibrionaceae bacterium]|nr:glycosyltransferase family 61 protein [Desulfovibrionaceae bacterium]